MDLKTREGRREQGELIKAAASAAGLTLKELATRVGVSHALIYQYVSGANLAQPDKLQEIAHITGVSVAYFFGEEHAGSDAPAARSAITSAAPPASTGPEVENRVQQTLRHLEALAQAQDSAGRDLPGLLRTLEQMLGLVRVASQQAREADLLFRIGNARTDAGELKSAAEALDESMSLFAALQNEPGRLAAAQSLARCRSLLGQWSEAEALFSQVASSPDPDLSWRGLVGVGQLMEQRDRHEEAFAFYERAREAVERSGETSVRSLAELYIRTNIANLYLAEGDYDSAVPLWRENLEQTERLSQPDQFLEALLSEGMCLLHLGQPGAAWERLKRGVRLCRLLGDVERCAVGLSLLSEVLTLAGLFDESKDAAREASRLSAECGSSRGVSLSQTALARALILAGQSENASFCLEPELRSPAPKIRASALLIRSELLRRGSQLEEAQGAARECLETIRDLGAPHLEKAAFVHIGLAAARANDFHAAAEWAEQAHRVDRLTPGLADTPWQLYFLDGEAAQAAGRSEEALSAWARSIETLHSLRDDFDRAGLVDALLDDPEKLDVYRRAVLLAREIAQDQRASRWIADAHWPPLSEEFS